MKPISLSLPERLILTNQFQILSALNPTEAEHYKELIEIAERGFSGQYGRFFDGFSHEGLTPEECDYVSEVLDMYWGLQSSYDELKDKGNLKPESLSFPGFDGNNELATLAYAKFLLKSGDFRGLRYNPSLNCHRETEARYRRMLVRYMTTEAGLPRCELSADEIQSILEA